MLFLTSERQHSHADTPNIPAGNLQAAPLAWRFPGLHSPRGDRVTREEQALPVRSQVTTLKEHAHLKWRILL